MSYKIDTFQYFEPEQAGDVLLLIGHHVKHLSEKGYKLAFLELLKNQPFKSTYIRVHMEKEDN